MLYHKKILITNKQSDPQVAYYFIKYLYENNKTNNNLIREEGYKIDSIQLDNNFIDFLVYNNGALKFFYEKGYITYSDNNNCIDLVGTTNCNKKSLLDNNLLYDR